MEKIIVEVVCTTCEGTGLYAGLMEHDGACVVCNDCGGTGKVAIEYEPFVKRKRKEGCERVYTNTGFSISAKAVNYQGKFYPFHRYGCSYEEWLAGIEPRQITFLGCPMMIDRGACYKIKGFYEKCEELNGGRICEIPSCGLYKAPFEACWKRFEEGEKK